MSQVVKRVYEVYIRTTPEKLWDALTNGDITTKYWYGGRIQRTPKLVGDPVVFADENGKVMHEGKVLEISAPRKLVHTFNDRWMPEEDRDPESRVTFEIAQLGPTCKLTVTHEHFNGESKAVRETNSGWQAILSGLKTVLETGEPLVIEWPEEALSS